MEDETVARRRSAGRLMRAAWRAGGRTERFAVLLGLLVLPFILAPLIYLLVAQRPYDEFRQAGGAYFLAFVSFYFYQQPFYGAMYGASFYRLAVDRGWVTAREAAFYSELLRYELTRGERGHLPGEVIRGFAYYSLYMGIVWLSVPLCLVLYPIVHDFFFVLFASVSMPLAVVCWYVDGRLRHRQFQKAQSEGFPLIDLEPWKIRRKKRSR